MSLLNFMRISKVVTTSILLYSSTVFAYTDNVSNIYVVARGNNKYEAKIRALDHGMRRAMMIVTDKMGIQDDALADASYDEISKVFSLSNIRNEKVTSKSYAEYTYEGVVDYTFSPAQVYALTLKYGSSLIRDKFYDCVVVPVFKLNNKLFVDDPKQAWMKEWKKYAKYMEKHEMYLTSSSDLEHKLSMQTLPKLTYNDALDLVPYQKYKNVLVVIIEYFVKRATGDSFLKFTKVKIGIDETVVSEETFDMPSRQAEIKELHESLIKKMIIEHGHVPDRVKKSGVIDLNTNDDDSLINKVAEEKKPVIMRIESYNPKETEEIERRLKTIKCAKSVEFIRDSAVEMVKIHTDADMEKVANDLYGAGLSFYQQGGNMVLIMRDMKSS